MKHNYFMLKHPFISLILIAALATFFLHGELVIADNLSKMTPIAKLNYWVISAHKTVPACLTIPGQGEPENQLKLYIEFKTVSINPVGNLVISGTHETNLETSSKGALNLSKIVAPWPNGTKKNVDWEGTSISIRKVNDMDIIFEADNVSAKYGMKFIKITIQADTVEKNGAVSHSEKKTITIKPCQLSIAITPQPPLTQDPTQLHPTATEIIKILPNLVTIIYTAPGDTTSNSSEGILCAVRNNGHKTTQTVKVSFIFDGKEVDYYEVEGLNKGEEVPLPMIYLSLDPGKHIFICRVDPDHTILESKENDNDKIVNFRYIP
jgi:hypothetical protein